MRGRLRCSGRGTGPVRLCRRAVRRRRRRGCAGRLRHFGGVFEPPGADAALQRPEFGFGGGDDLGCAGGVTAGAGVGFDHNRAGPVVEADIGGAAAVLGDFDPGGVVFDGRKVLCGVGVAAQLCGQYVVEPGVGDRVDVGCRIRPRSATTQIRPTANRSREVGENGRQGGGVVGVARHTMRDRYPV